MKKEINKCMAEIYDPGEIRTRAAQLLSQYHNHLVQITVPKGDVTFRLVASGYRDKPDKISWKFRTYFVRKFELS